MNKHLKWLFFRTKVFTITFRNYKFYHLINVENNKEQCIKLLKLLMGHNSIFIMELENEIDCSTLDKTELRLLSYTYDDNHIYSFYGDVDRLIEFIYMIIQHLNSIFAINFLTKPSSLVLQNASYSTLQTDRLLKDNLIDNAVTFDFDENQIIIEISKNNSEIIKIINSFTKNIKKHSYFYNKEI